jgi:hypothetical protein
MGCSQAKASASTPTVLTTLARGRTTQYESMSADSVFTFQFVCLLIFTIFSHR